MAHAVIVQVPADDVAELERLGAQVGDEEIELLHPFDGETVAQLVLVVSTTSLPFLRAWVKMRIEARKAVVVIHNGNELRGYTADEAERILAVLNPDGAAARDGH